ILVAAAPAIGLVPHQLHLVHAITRVPTRSGLRQSSKSVTVSPSSPSPFGGCERIDHDLEDASFLSECGVPSWKAGPGLVPFDVEPPKVRVEHIPHVPGAFVLHGVLTSTECESLLDTAEALGFGHFDAGKNKHGALQVMVHGNTGDSIFARIKPYLPATDLSSAAAAAAAAVAVNAVGGSIGTDSTSPGSTLYGINARWRFFKYCQDGTETFAPHIDCAWTGSGLDPRGERILWDAFGGTVRSRYTLLLYLNGDFSGGETKFYRPYAHQTDEKDHVIATVRPRQGSVLVFPQAVGETARDHAWEHWPTHEGSPLTSGPRAKYVVRSDILYKDDDDDIQSVD
ncbi:unnamed protein product, partial [Choristocarpus tenellus]